MNKTIVFATTLLAVGRVFAISKITVPVKVIAEPRTGYYVFTHTNIVKARNYYLYKFSVAFNNRLTNARTLILIK